MHIMTITYIMMTLLSMLSSMSGPCCSNMAGRPVLELDLEEVKYTCWHCCTFTSSKSHHICIVWCCVLCYVQLHTELRYTLGQ